MAEQSSPKKPKEVDVFNRYTKFNKGRTILIALLIAVVAFVVVFMFSKSLMIYTITINTDGGLVYGEEIEIAEYRFLNKTKEPVGLKKEGYYIEGYYRNSDMTDRFEFGGSIWKSEVLYVNWQPGYAVQLNFAEGEEEWSNMSLYYLKTYHEQYVKPGSSYTLHQVINDIPYLKIEGEANHEGEQLLWFEDAECSGDPIEIKTYVVDKNIPLYGRWFDTTEDKFEISSDGTLQRYLGYCNKIILPDSVKKIKDITPTDFIGSSDQLNDENGERVSAFQNVLTSLEIVYINENCIELGSCSFRSCTALSKIYFKGNNVSVIGDNAFAFCTSLNTIYIPSSVETIERRAFYGTTNLKTITGLDGVKTIGDDAFNGANLKSIELNSIESLGKLIFSGCYNLKTIIIRSSAVVSTNVTESQNNILYNTSDTTKIYVPSELIDAYKSSFPWNEYADRIYDITDLS